MRIVFVAAGGPHGLGHLGRSTALAQALQLRGVDVTGYVADGDEAVVVDGMAWRALSALPGLPERPGADLLVGDGYSLGDETLARFGARLTVRLHDSAVGPDPLADLVIDPVGDPAPGRLTGAPCFCLRRDYWSPPQSRVATTAREVLVAVGGTDAGGPVGELAARIAAIDPAFRVRMVRGPRSGSSAPAGVDLLDRPASLRGEFEHADLAVVAAGQTSLEALCCGVPTIALVRATNQQAQAALLERAAAALTPSDDELEAAVRRTAADPDLRSRMAANGRALIDGLGAHRVADRLLGDLLAEPGFRFAGICLRAAGPADSDFVLELRNDPTAYRYFGSPEPVTDDEHRSWLTSVLEGSGSDLLVVEDGSERVGSLRVIRSGAGGSAQLGINLAGAARGRGLGRRAISAACAYSFVRDGSSLITAVIHPDNAASRVAFANVGFSLEGREAGGFLRFTLHREEFQWPPAT